MSESLLCFADENLPTRRLSQRWRIRCHWILQVIAATITIGGFVVVALHKFLLNKHHFKTNHAVWGLVSMICCALTMAGGCWTNYGHELRGYLRPVWAKILHGAIGLLNYAMVTATVILGFFSSWFGKHGTASAIFVCSPLIVCVVLYVVAKPIRRLAKRLKAVAIRAYDL